MASPLIKIRRSATPNKVPLITQLQLGELAINTYEGKLYLEQDQGGVGVGNTVIAVNPWGVGIGSTAYNTQFTAGKVGVGTTSAKYNLDVGGDINFTGNLYQDGSAFTSGVGIRTAGGTVGWAATIIDFRGPGVTTAYYSSSTGIGTVYFQGGGGSGTASVTTDDTAPSNPADGDLWFNSNVGELYIYYQDPNTSQWVEAAGGSSTVVTSDTAPSGPNDGDLWWNSNTGELKIYYNDGSSSQWVDAASGGYVQRWGTATTAASAGINTASAFVGIGTTTATDALTVTGNAKFTGVVTATSFSGTINSATNATNIAVSANNTTNETVYPLFVDGATGNQGAETDTGFTYNPSLGALTATTFSGNASTASALQNARTIGGVSFDGTANINLPGVNQAGNQNTSGNAATATALQNARTIGGVSFDGTANINLPGVNQAGNQNTSGTSAGLTGTPNITVADIIAASLDISGNADIDGTLEADAYTVNGTALNEYIADTVGAMVSSNTETGITVTYEDSDNTLDFVIGTLNQNTTGNAATATALQNARTIGGVSFDGTANINLPGVNIAGNQNTTGTAAGLTGSPSIAVNSVTGVAATFTGNLTVGGVLTYEDVTNIDSVGIITARAGIVAQDDVTFTGNSANALWDKSDDALELDDGAQIRINGTSLRLLNNGTTGLIKGNDLQFMSMTGNDNYITCTRNAGVQLGYNDSWKFETTNTGATVTGTLIADAINLGDSEPIRFGASNDLTIQHNGSHSYIADTGTGDLRITGSAVHIQNAAQSENMIKCFEDGQVELYYDNSKKFQTTSAGGTLTGTLTATAFSGPLTGNVTGNTSGSSGSCTGNAATATALQNARTIGGVSFDGTANINLPGVNISGNQDTTGTATNATNFTCTANNSTDETVYPVFVDGATGNQGGETDTGFTYNPSDGNLTSTTFTGNLTGNVTGNTSGSSGSCTGNAATATALQNARTIGGVSFDGTANINLPGVNQAGNQNTSGNAATASLATEFTTTANNTTNETVYPVFVDGATGSQGAETDTGLTYNPSTGNLSATKFIGDGSALTGVISGIGIGTAGGVVGYAATIVHFKGAGVTTAYYNASTGIGTVFFHSAGGGGGNTNVTIQDAPPSSPSAGDLWWESDTGELKIYYNDGNTSQWVDANGSEDAVFMSTTAPSSAQAGDLWFNTESGDLMVYYTDANTSQWVSVNASTSGSTHWHSNTTGISTTQYVGIGTTTATDALTVLGATDLDGRLLVSGFTTFTGRVTLDNGTNAGRDIQWQPASDRLAFFNNTKATFGDGVDLQIVADGSNSKITHNGDGNLWIEAAGAGEDIYLQAADDVYIRTQGGENAVRCLGDGAVELYHNGTKKAYTTTGGFKVDNKLELPDGGATGTSARITVGTSDDLKIYHDSGGNSYIKESGGGSLVINADDFYLQNNATTTYLRTHSSGVIDLNHNGNKKFETTSSGAKVTGNLEVTGVLTYEDVTNIDSIGIVTARDHIKIKADNKSLYLGASDDFQLFHNGSHNIIKSNNGNLYLQDADYIEIGDPSGKVSIGCVPSGATNLRHNGTTRLITSGDGVSVTGSVVSTHNSGNIGYELHATGSGTGAQTKYHNDHGVCYVGVAGDTTGEMIVYNEANTAMKFYTNAGSPKITIAANGNVGVNDSTPNSKFSVTDTYIFSCAGGNSTTGMQIGGYDAGANSYNPITVRASQILFNISGTEKARIESGGRLLLGTNTNSSPIGWNNNLQIAGTNAQAGISIRRDSADTGGAILVFGKSRGSLNGNTVVQNGDQIGGMYFAGGDGTDVNSIAAQISVEVDGTPGGNDMPGRLIFKTTADGAASATERLRIDKNGDMCLGGTPFSQGTGNTFCIHSSGTGGGDHAYLYFTNGDSGHSASNGMSIGLAANQVANISVREAWPLAFSVNGSERARIHSHGQLELMVPDANDALKITPSGTNAHAKINFNTPGTGSAIFKVQGTERFSINTSGNLTNTGQSTSYVTTTFSANFAKLDLRGTNIANSNHYILSYGEGHANDHEFHMVNTIGDIVFRTNAGSNTERLRVKSSGVVMAGMDNFSGNVTQALDIRGRYVNAEGDFARLMFRNSSDSGGSSASIRALRTGDNYGTNLTFWTQLHGGSSGGDGLERLRIETDGDMRLVNGDFNIGNSDTTGGNFIIFGKNGNSIPAIIEFHGKNSSGGGNPKAQIKGVNNTYAWASDLRFYTQDHNINLSEHFRIQYNGDLLATDTSIGSLSDSRLKTNITNYTYDLSKFKQFQPKTFDWKNPIQHGGKSGVRGFLAQDLESIDSSYVSSYLIEKTVTKGNDDGTTTTTDNPDLEHLDADGIAKASKFGPKDAMYISVINQLISKIETLETKVAALESS